MEKYGTPQVITKDEGLVKISSKKLGSCCEKKTKSCCGEEAVACECGNEITVEKE